MRTDFVALSAPGLFAAVFAGFLLGEAYKDHDIMYVLMSVLMFLVVWQDTRPGFDPGSYKRGWLLWHKTNSLISEESEG